ncbi:hypothetical protein [Rhodopseudomonas palustris]|uniref:hypothetical protein n=1 Tax=Rhodopseudomonas palustris TaxID=1076 RepID=UPI001AECCB69|nr:hypothetical protein [Rhodopseudomonas palustris]
MATLPAATAATTIALPNPTALTGQMLNDLTRALGVSRTVLPSDQQIAHAWSNLPRLLEKIPAQHRNETVVRMCVAVSAGLFDSAINYAWNAAVVELREKVRRFGLTVVHHVTAKTFDEATLVDLKDADLLSLCLKLNLVSEDGYFFLDQCRDTRNNFSAAHPSMGSLDEDEFLVFLSRCSRHALSMEDNPRGVDIHAFVAAIKASRFAPEQLHTWVQRLEQTFEAQRDALFGTLHGIYCDPSSGEEARVNALDVCGPFRETLSPHSKSELVDRHQGYRASGDDVKSKASSQFFEKLGLLSLLGESEIHLVITTASGNLLSVHNAMNNFYNEPPFAQRLEYLASQNRVPATAQQVFVESVITCAIGNPYGVSHAAMPSYEKMVKSFSPNEVAIMLNLTDSPTVAGKNIQTYGRCRKMFAYLVTLIAATSVPTNWKARYDWWLTQPKN